MRARNLSRFGLRGAFGLPSAGPLLDCRIEAIELVSQTFLSCPSPPIKKHLWTKITNPNYLMTRFARERNSGESVSPICFAAFKLMTNSNLVACCTGKSAGLAPFKILST